MYFLLLINLNLSIMKYIIFIKESFNIKVHEQLKQKVDEFINNAPFIINVGEHFNIDNEDFIIYKKTIHQDYTIHLEVMLGDELPCHKSWSFGYRYAVSKEFELSGNTRIIGEPIDITLEL